MEKRYLTPEEIDDILSTIVVNKSYDPEVVKSICHNVSINIKNQLKKVKVYPAIIPELKEKVRYAYETSFLHPGENVGCIAASSIGEQNTQASLNSFHSAGIGKANLTTGVPRLKELLNASRDVKTPSCTIYLKPDIGDLTDLYVVKNFCDKEIIYYNIRNLVKEMVVEYRPALSEYDSRYYSFFKNFYDDSFEPYKWRIRLSFCVESLFKIKKSLSYITGCIKLALTLCHENISIIFFPDTSGIIDVWVNDNIDNPLNVIKKKQSKQGDELKNNIVLLTNDENKVYFFIKDVVSHLINECPVSGIFGIEECYFNEEKGGAWSVTTKGSNYREILNHPHVDFTRTRSNNIWDIHDVLGINAARTFLEEEFFKNLSNLNKRHLDLLTANMTTTGKICSVSRYGIDRKQVGPLAKMCFEQPFDNAIQAALNGEKDYIIGASASVCTGRTIKSGTGMVKLLVGQNNSLPFKKDVESFQEGSKNLQKNNDAVNKEALRKIIMDPWFPKKINERETESEDEGMDTFF
jgi:DNA-directed RNA polymerase II subunit RPB1